MNRNNKFKPDFSFKKSYSDAPNPVVKLPQLGTVALPLCDGDAEAIKSGSIQAPFGQGEHTVVDKKVRNTWQIDSNQV